MRKLYLFLLLIAFSTAINAQFITLDGTGIIKGMTSDGKYVLGTSRTYVISPEGVEYKAETGHAISASGKIVGLSGDNDYIMNFYDEEGEWVSSSTLITGAFRNYGESTWNPLPLFLGNNLEGEITNNTMYGDYPTAINDEGNIIVGGFMPMNGAVRKVAGYWLVTDDGKINQVRLENDYIGVGSMVYGVSGDGSIMVGYYGGANDFSASRVATFWEDGRRIDIQDIVLDTYLSAVSHNGHYAALNVDKGTALEYYGISPIRAGVCDLVNRTYKYLNQDATLVSVACAVSNDGTVVGYQGTGANRRAFVYTPTRGMMNLNDLLDELGVDYPSNFTFYEVNAIATSANGHILAGYGTENGNAKGFYVEIPAIAEGVYSVEDIDVMATGYGKVRIDWERPQDNQHGIALTGYEVYRDKVRIKTVEESATSYEDTVGDGTYTYYIKPVYATDQYPSQESKRKTVTMGRLAIPHFDTFDDYTLQDAESLRERKYWDVTTNTVSLENTWQTQLSGYPPYCVEFQVPVAGLYSETLSTAFIDASELESLHFNFAITISSSANHVLAIDVYDGTKWHQIDQIRDTQITPGNFIPKRYNITKITVGNEEINIAGKDNIRVRFRASGTGNGNKTQWVIDNLEITDDENALTYPKPLDIQITQREENGAVFISWVGPEDTAELSYNDTGLWTASMIGNEGKPFIAANMFPAEELSIYDGYYITHLSFMPSSRVEYDEDGNKIEREPAQYVWYISQNGKRLCEEKINGVNTGNLDPDNISSFEWFKAELDSPVRIDGSKDLYYGVEVIYHDEDDLPIATSDIYHTEIYKGGEVDIPVWISHNIADGRANLYSENDGEKWETLFPYFDEEYGNYVYPIVNVSASLTRDPYNKSTLSHFTSYKVLRNGENIITERYLEGALHTRNTTTVDFYYPQTGQEACYEVKAHYITLVDSDPLTECVTITLTSTAIDSYEKDANGISIYPSPVIKGQSVNVDLGEAAEYTGNIRVYNATGGLFKNIPIIDRVTSVDINFPAGIYFVQVNDKVVKIVVE